MSSSGHPHIEMSPSGVALVAGTRTSVKEVVLDYLAHGWGADEIHRQHPHLSLSKIHAAFAYYYDHQEKIDRAIQEDLRDVERLRQELGDSKIQLKLKAAGLLP